VDHDTGTSFDLSIILLRRITQLVEKDAQQGGRP